MSEGKEQQSPNSASKPSLEDLSAFYFRLPLYLAVETRTETDLSLAKLLHTICSIDGICPECGKDSTFFTRPPLQELSIIRLLQLGQSINPGIYQIEAECTRSKAHKQTIVCLVEQDTIRKIGQWPSLATMLLDEMKPLRSALSKEDAEELHKAIGLAAHGVGVGSFVYLRRIFERLIYSCFNHFQVIEKWSEEEFSKLRMPEKIELLSSYLPPLLVKNRALYGILSKGLHELSEAECRTYFSVVRQAVFLILHQEAERKKREKNEKELSNEITRIHEELAQSKNKE